MPVEAISPSSVPVGVVSPIADSSDETLESHLAPFLNSSSNSEINELLLEVFKILIENQADDQNLIQQVLEREEKSRQVLKDLIQQETISIRDSGNAQNFCTKLQDLVIPLSLVGQGIASLMSNGPEDVGAIALTAFGGLLVLDKLFDDAGKQTLAGWLGKLTGERPKDWLDRIATVTTLGSVALPLFTTGGQSLGLMMNLSRATVQVARDAVAYTVNQHSAKLTEYETAWDISGTRLKNWLGNLKENFAAHNNLYDLLKEWQDSERQAVASIFAG